MRRAQVFRRILRAILAVVFAALLAFVPCDVGHAQTASRPNLAEARETFERLADRDRNELYLMLIATGDFNAMASNQFGGRLYDAIASFQAKNGLEPTGIITPETFGKLNAIGGRIFNSWGFNFLDHPSANASVVIPDRFGLVRTTTPRGLAFEGRNHAISIDFSFFPASEAGMAEVFTRLTQPVPGRRIDMKVIKPTFFAVAGGTDSTASYSRFIPVSGGIAGFTIAWNTAAYPNAIRLAVVMANELFPRHMVDQARADTAFDPGSSDSETITRRGGFADPGAEATPLNGAADQAVSPDQQRDIDDKVLAAQKAREEEAKRVAEELQKTQREERDRKEKADQDARQAREAIEYRLVEERFKRALATARAAVDDASGFIKGNPGNPRLLDYAQRIVEVTATLSGSDPDATEKRVAALTGALNRDTEYLRFAARRAEQRRRQYARDLDDAVRILRAQKAFLVGVIARDPASAEAMTFLPLVRQIDGVVGSNTLDRAQTLAGAMELAIQHAGLAADYDAARKAEAAEAARAANAARITALASPTPGRPTKDDLYRPGGP